MQFFALAKLLPQIGDVMDGVQTKGWYASKQIWWQVLVMALYAITKVFEYDIPIQEADLESIALGLSTGGAIVLRFFTRTPIGVRRGSSTTSS